MMPVARSASTNVSQRGRDARLTHQVELQANPIERGRRLRAPQIAWQLQPTLGGAAPRTRLSSRGIRHFGERAQSPIDCRRVWEAGGDVGREHHNVRPLAIPRSVLAADAPAKVIVG